MKLDKIITRRHINKEAYYDIVYEWENEISSRLEVSFVRYDYFLSRILQICKLFFFNKILHTSRPALYFEMFANEEKDKSYNHGINKKSVIPFIIDYYPKAGDAYRNFCNNYSRNSIVLISSKEVYEYLQREQCILRLAHLALSLPDLYRITPETKFEKQFDILLLGRQNPVLGKFLEIYQTKHPNMRIAYRKAIVNGQNMIYDQDGILIGDANTRERFIEICRRAKVCLYSTPGMDSEKDTNGFNQVTPRLLEYIAAGSHILARYPDNADTRYYELSRFSPNIENYEQFEQRMDYALSHDVDMKMYSEYLSKHYTSRRVEELKCILSQIE